MQHFKPRFGATLLLGALLCASSARAQTGGAPDMSDFGGAIAQGVEDAPEPKAAPIPKGGIASGLSVPRVKPGKAAHEMFETMRERVREAGQTNPEMLKLLPAYDDIEKQAPVLLKAIEDECVKRGFAPRDMGTAYALAFLGLRESATGRTTTDAQDTAVVRTVSGVITEVMGQKWKTLTPAHKEKMYETLLLGAAIQGAIIDKLVETGDETRLAAQRQDAAQAFQKLIGVPAEQVEISDEGQISGTVPVAPDDAPTAPEVAPE